jgi:hypothetical protein
MYKNRNRSGINTENVYMYAEVLNAFGSVYAINSNINENDKGEDQKIFYT